MSPLAPFLAPLSEAQELNAFLRDWARQVPHAAILDLDALSGASPFKPPLSIKGDIHFQCKLRSDGLQVPCIHTNTHGGCTDTLNTMLVQLMINHMCNHKMKA